MPDLDDTASLFSEEMQATYPLNELLVSLFQTSVTGFVLCTPIRDAAGAVVDFNIDLFNPAAQRMTGRPGRPGGTYLEHFPHALETGVFAFQRDAFERDEPAVLAVNYQGDGLDNYFRIAARRVGKGLLMSFTDTADQPRTEVEVALRASQARERAALADVQAQRAELQRVFEHAPVAVSILRGPQFVVELANRKMGLIWGRSPAQIIGQEHFVALPDLANQGFEEVFADVFQTGNPRYFQERLVHIDQASRHYQGYFNITYQPTYDGQGHIVGITASAVEVTEQVLARQQVQNLNEELSAINEELRTSNEEYLIINTELTNTQLQLQRLNQELEVRVAKRTKQLEDSLRQARQQRLQLADQQELLRQIMEQMPAGIATLSGPEHRYTFVNERHQELTSHLAALGKTAAEVFPRSARQRFTKVLDQVYATGEPYQHRDLATPFTSLTTCQWPRRYVDFSYQPLRDGRGLITGVLVFIVDVTEKMLARQQAEAAQAQVLAVFEQAPVAVFVLQGVGHVFELVNSSMSKLLGRSPTQLLGQPYFEAVPELATQGYQELLDEVWRTGETHVEQEREAHLAYHGPDEVGYFNFVYQPLRSVQGEVTSIACVATEVTEQVLARRQVQRLNEELQAMNQELRTTNQQLRRTNVDLDNFIYTASHDLKAPISNIEGLLQAVQRELPGAGRVGDVPLMLGMMQSAVERFKRTIGHLTEVSRLQKEHEQPTTSVNLARIVREVSLDLAPQLAEVAAQLTVEIPEDLTLTFSEKNLRSVVYNLLSNALKYRHPSRVPAVRIEGYREAAENVLLVQDNGLGMNLAQSQRKLFVMFQRLHTHVEGSGVGLYMVKKMVENAGGRIEVQSEVGQGTTFNIYLPG
jgi:PAS domain S-box-containing protein